MQGHIIGFEYVVSFVLKRTTCLSIHQYIDNLPGSLKGTRMYVKEAPFSCNVLRTKSIDIFFTSLISSDLRGNKDKRTEIYPRVL